MVVVKCTIPNCAYATDDVSEALAIALLTNHGHAHAANANTGSSSSSGPKLERPKVNVGVTLEEWNVFIGRWEIFRRGSGINDASSTPQFFQCAEKELGDSVLKVNSTAATGPLDPLIKIMRSLAVIPIATGVLRTELLQMKQERDEPFRAFAARVRGKAETCGFTINCTCGNSVDYTDNSIRDTLLNGIDDHDIRREALGTTNILDMQVNDVIALIENKEMARNALPASSLSAVSSFRRQQNTPPAASPSIPSNIDRKRQSNCLDC